MNTTPIHRWLLASLVLNLFLVGGVVGGTVRWWMAERGTATAAPARSLRYAADDLSAAQRKAYLLGLRTVRRDAAASIQAAREGREDVLRLMGAPQFDRNAVAAALARTRDADIALRARVEASVVDFAATLTPEDRLKLTNGLARRSTLSPPSPAPAKP